MCIAIFNKAGFTLPKEMLEICWENNPHGGGLAWVAPDPNGVPMVDHFKSLSRNEFIEAYFNTKLRYPDSNMLVHFRITTHGGTNLLNTHPFPVLNTTMPMMLIHNGVIPGFGSTTRSDTNEFCGDFLSHLPCGWENHEPMKRVLGKVIGNSKLVMLRADNTVMIVNETMGNWNVDKTCWFSNTSFRKRVLTTYESSTYWADANKQWESVATATGNSQRDRVRSPLPIDSAFRAIPPNPSQQALLPPGRLFSEDVKRLVDKHDGTCPWCTEEIDADTVAYNVDTNDYSCTTCDCNLTTEPALPTSQSALPSQSPTIYTNLRYELLDSVDNHCPSCKRYLTTSDLMPVGAEKDYACIHCKEIIVPEKADTLTQEEQCL